MPDREKVIKGLHDIGGFIAGRIGFEQAKNFLRTIDEAIVLLKEHRPRETFTVVDTKTGKEADEYEIALHEDWAKHLCYCDMEGWAIENDGTLLLVDECGQFAYADRERFKVVWDD